MTRPRGRPRKAVAPAVEPPTTTRRGGAARDVSVIPEEFLDCRDIGHTWLHQRTTDNPRFRTYSRVVGCSRCGSERTQTIHYDGHLAGANYRYAHGYLLQGSGIWTTDDRARMRLRNIKRML